MKENKGDNLTVVTVKARFTRKTKHVLITKLIEPNVARILSVVDHFSKISPDVSLPRWRYVSYKADEMNEKTTRGKATCLSQVLLSPLCEKNKLRKLI